MDDETRFALDDAEQTLARAQSLADQLEGVRAEADKMSIAPRQADELARFVKVYRDELVTYRDKLQASGTPLDRQLTATRRMELEESVRFIERAFVQPRTTGSEIQVLEAADWMCGEGFQEFVPDTGEQPIGPIVAIDSAQSPAVWAPDASLPIPSLFNTVPKKADRTKLAPFPLICLPGHLCRSPEYFPLLSHEVGHAIDHALDLSDTILAEPELVASVRLKYWRAWMREIVADAVGVALSGQAFLVALSRYLDQLTPLAEVSAANAYPANELRLAFVGACLRNYGGELSVEEEIPTDERIGRINRTAKQLLGEFRTNVLPALARHTLDRVKDWNVEEQAVAELAARVASAQSPVVWPKLPFRLMPSAIALAARGQQGELETYQRFRELHGSVKDKPEWVAGKTKWVFSEEYLPSLRPTLLGGDGSFKVPPVLLLTTHQKIAFVGATNWQLRDKMEEAFEKRDGEPWEEIHLFFASDKLLLQVDYGDLNASEHRDKSQQEFVAALTAGPWAKRWAIYQFDSPPVFASYWDWDVRGGRIHISPALLGTEIGKCPSSDQIWHTETSTDHYQKYVTHLETLLRPDQHTVIAKS